MNTNTNHIAKALLLLTATAFAAAVSNTARADDGYVEYADTVRYYDRLSPVQATGAPVSYDLNARRLGVICAPQRHRHLGYVSALRREADAAPGIVQITATQAALKEVTTNGSGYYITFLNAEVTGAAKGQTVNRAINDLN